MKTQSQHARLHPFLFMFTLRHTVKYTWKFMMAVGQRRFMWVSVYLQIRYVPI